ILANLWVLGLDFQFDDFPLLVRVPKRFVPEPWPATEVCSGTSLWFHEEVAPVPDRYLFRPASWGLYWLLARLGEPPSPFVFHLSVLLAHAFATWLLFEVMRRPAGSLAAAIAATTFALAPGSLQAVAWVSACGDTLAVAFLASSTLLLQRGRERG